MVFHSHIIHIHMHAETKSTIMTNEHTFLEKCTSHFIRKGCERVAQGFCVRGELETEPGYIIVWHPPAFCGRHICSQFNPSTVKVIPWYLRPDAPVIYTGASLIWQLRRGSICYKGFQVFLCITTNSIKHRSFVYTHLNDQTILFQIIQFSISCFFAQFKCQITLTQK